MARKLALGLAVAFACSSICAQTPSFWVGTWKVSWPNAQGKVQEAKMVVGETGAGSWQTYTRALDNPCIGREVPIQVEQASDGAARIVLKFGDAIAGCTNSTLELKVGENKAVTGTRGKQAISLEKR